MKLHRIAPLVAVCFLAVFCVTVIAAENAKPAPGNGREQKKDSKPLPKLMDLGSTTCTPCKMMMSVLDSLKKDYRGKLAVVFVDIAKDSAAASKYKIQRIPTQIWFDAKGKEIDRHIGYISKDDIAKTFKKHGIKLSK